jgi:signal transduction histidine kinase
MWKHINMRTRISLILAGLVVIILCGGLGAIWYSFRMEKLVSEIVDTHLAAFRTAEALEIALVNQKGFASYYFIDGNPDWLRQLGEYRQIFKERLKEARQGARNADQQAMIARIAAEYDLYVESKDRVLDFYQQGNREEGARLHREVRDHFFKLLTLSEEYKALHERQIQSVRTDTQAKVGQLRAVVVASILFSSLLAVALALVFIRQVLEPVRRLTREASREGPNPFEGNEISALSRSVRGLIEDVGHTQIELEKSRENLLQAEKMALVGKLAAGMAHSIRNPFTSVKMRLFSLNRSLDLSEAQEEDFQVISDEIRHIDTIVQNFLEFSRPPKLQLQRISPSAVVDMACQLLEHRLRAYDVSVQVLREATLPEIEADPDQLKEVLVNLVVNACEAMEKGGRIEIRERLATVAGRGNAAVIEVSDDGPGISEEMREKVFQPFFTTKEEGTGLGLSIATRIVGEHRGTIDVSSTPGRGTTFIITLPIG